jgi:lysophospholipase L1-like esterase/predicted ester cyclase
VRLVVHTSLGADRVRVRLANVFDDHPLVVGAAHIARRTTGASIDPPTDRVIRFGGRTSVEVPGRSFVLSDPVLLDVPALSDVAVSLYLPGETRATTTHVLALQTSYVSPPTGDATGAATLPAGTATTKTWPFLAGLDVATTAPGTIAAVVFGDSTVDGDGSTPDTNRRWPDVLAARLHAEGAPVAVLNEGLIGNRLLHDSPTGNLNPVGSVFGRSALARFERDALGQSGVGAVIVRIGINDIAFPGALAPPTERVTVDTMAAGYRQLVARARQRHVRVIGSTLSPFEGAALFPNFYSLDKEAIREELNAWIRDGGEFDAVVDFDEVLRDPAHPARLNPAYDSGDHLHPNDAGYAAMARAVPSTLFTSSWLAAPAPAAAPSQTPSMVELQQRALGTIVAAVKTHDASTLAPVYTEHTVFASPGGNGWVEQPGRDAFVEDHRRLFSGFPDLEWAPARAVAVGNVLAAEWVTRGTNTAPRGNRPATNARMGFRAASVFWFNDRGLIVREHAYIDFAAMSGQLHNAPGHRDIPPMPTGDAEWIVASGPSVAPTSGATERSSRPALWAMPGEQAYADAVDEDFIHDDVAAGTKVEGRAANLVELQAYRKAFPDMEVSVDGTWTAGDTTVVEFTLRGTQRGAFGQIAATNREVLIHGLDVDRWRNGRLITATTYTNGAQLASQLGLEPR